ncbi:MAG TPA: hypothetical protein VF786_11655 [Terriglobales bacterium]
MRRFFGWIVMVLFCCPPVIAANYQKAEVISMKTVSCDRVHALDPEARPVVNAFIGGATPMPNDDACTAYELRTSKVVYHVMTAKNLILPVGETVQIRLTSREMTVHAEEGEKDIRATILDMSLVEKSAAKHESPATPAAPLPEPARRNTHEQSVRNCLSQNGEVIPCNR